eukprot:TRINITY_DN18260_c0_g2_i1.p1 TRINITY_DN18260_c0_g2~~TRINITY_DN18260_c0_g2_i1.p1  ORF type:complete len:862 (+),score=191.49 TRINITY_DN18260_c0_g2_i1:82-2667(+)
MSADVLTTAVVSAPDEKDDVKSTLPQAAGDPSAGVRLRIHSSSDGVPRTHDQSASDKAQSSSDKKFRNKHLVSIQTEQTAVSASGSGSDTPQGSGRSGGTPRGPISPRNAKHTPASAFQPFPERNTYDAMLCEFSKHQFDWQCYRFDSDVNALSFAIEKFSSSTKQYRVPRVIAFQISLGAGAVAAAPSDNGDGTPTELDGNLTPETPRSLKDEDVTPRDRKASKNVVKSSSSSSGGLSSAFTPKKKAQKKFRFFNDVHLVVISQSQKVYSKIDVGMFKTVTSQSGTANNDDEKTESGQSARSVNIETQDGEKYELTFSSSGCKEKFIRVLKSVCAVLLTDSEFGIACRMDMSNSRIFATHNMICFHQGELVMGSRIVMSEADGSGNKKESSKTSYNPAAEKKKYSTYEFDADYMYKVLTFQGRLLIFGEKVSGAPTRVFDLAHAKVGDVHDPECRVELSKHVESMCFQLDICAGAEAESYVFLAAHVEERERWVSAIGMAIRENRKEANAESEIAESEDMISAVIPANQSLLDQKTFFEYVRMSIHPIEIICTTETPSISSWKEHFGELPKSKKGKDSRSIEQNFVQYHELCDRIHRLLVHGLLVCDDGNGYRGDENIGFSYPGYENEMFRVGPLSVVRVWRLFRGSGRYTSFSLSGWDGTLGARSIGKELMQTLPEVQELYEFGRSAEAKEICTMAAMEELQNLIIAQYIKIRRQDFYSNAVQQFSWMDALRSQGRKDSTKELLKYKEQDNYVFNPPVDVLQDYLRGRLEGFFSSSNIAVWTQLNWLEAMRLIHQERNRCLAHLDASLTSWFESNGLQRSKNLMFYTRLQASIKDEHNALRMLLERLPSHEKLIDHYSM